VFLGVLVFLWAMASYNSIPDPQVVMDELVSFIPAWVGGTLSVLYLIAAVYVIGLFVALLLQWRQRLDAVRDMVLASVTALLLATVLVRLITDTWPRVLIELGRAEPISQYPMIRVVLVTASLMVISPHVTRPVRRVGWFAIVTVAVAGVGLGLGLPSSAIGSVALGVAASGVVLLVFGSPKGYPDRESISHSLQGLGIEVSNLSLDDDQSWGVRRLTGWNTEFGSVEIKAYGRDATDSQFAARLWRLLWYRDTEPTLAMSRMQNVEHEALVTMMASRTGAAIPDVLAAGIGGAETAILAVNRSGERLIDLGPEDVLDATLVKIWESIGHLHGGRISHGSLSVSTITLAGTAHQIGDFGSGSLAASDSSMALDVVELLVSMSMHFGIERTVATAQVGLGQARLAQVASYIQVPAVSAAGRRALDKPKAFIKAVQDEVIRSTAAEVEETVQIRRVEAKNLIMTGVTLFAVYFLITQLSDIDFVAVWEEMQTADWVWIALAFLVAQLVYLPEATAMLAAVGYPIPLFAATVLQSSIKFISLAVPSSAGRIAMTATFLRKYGIGFTASLVQGSLDTLSGLLVEVLILVLALLSGDLPIELESGETEWGPILLVVVGLVVLIVYLIRRVQRLRDWVMPVLGEAFGALGDVLKSPRRTLALVSSNFASRFILAVSMWLILESLGVTLGIWLVLTATVATGLLGGIIPVPGGVGVTEAILTGFLVMFGVDEATAFAAAVIYRVVTFYIPSGGGFFSMKWLEKNGYV